MDRPKDAISISASDAARPENLLEKLDNEQNDVIAGLDDLNRKIELLLHECSQDRAREAA